MAMSSCRELPHNVKAFDYGVQHLLPIFFQGLLMSATPTANLLTSERVNIAWSGLFCDGGR